MIADEPAAWNLIPAHKRERVECVAKAMCRSHDADDGRDAEDYCGCCDTPEGGSCIAFGLWGQMAIAVVEALDALDRGDAS